MGDRVTLDYDGYKDDVAFDGGKGENYELELGSNTFIRALKSRSSATASAKSSTSRDLPGGLSRGVLKGAARSLSAKSTNPVKDVPAATTSLRRMSASSTRSTS
jgi:trigger factor